MKESLKDRLLVDEETLSKLDTASIALWGMLAGKPTKEEIKIIDEAAMAIEKVIELLRNKC